MSILKRVRTLLEKEINISHSTKYLLAVSGGIDSMVMLHIFNKLNYNIVVAHCNFQLRGLDSENDQNLVIDYCHQNRIPVLYNRFDVHKYKEENNVSTQIAARHLRYEWFSLLMIEHHIQFLCTAHHQDDNEETILLNLVQGGILQSLTGILPKSGNILRPLINCSKKEIFEYALKNNIPYLEDISNLSDDYKRNFIRHQITPLLSTLNVNHTQTIQQAGILRGYYVDLATNLASKIKPEYQSEDRLVIKVENDFGNPSVLYHYFYSNLFEIDFKDIVAMSAALTSTEFKRFDINPVKDLYVGKSKIYILKVNPLPLNIKLEIGYNQNLKVGIFTIILEWMESQIPLKNNHKNTFYFEIPSIAQLAFETRKNGQKFSVSGKIGTSLVSDLMTNAKIPLPIKNIYPILYLDDKPIFIPLIGQAKESYSNLGSNNKIVLKLTCTSDYKF